MLSIDTNVVVRFLTADDPAQHRRAVALLKSNPVWLTRTVVLETAWVLRAAYGFPISAIIAALRGLLALQNLSCEAEPEVIDALDWAGKGMDFADALHLASSKPASAFATFDRKLIKRAKTMTSIKLVAV